MAEETYRTAASSDKALSLTRKQAQEVIGLVEFTLLPVLSLNVALRGDGECGGLLSDVAYLLELTLNKFQADLLTELMNASGVALAEAPDLPDKFGGTLERPAESLVELLFHRDLYEQCRTLFEQGELQQICDLLNKRQEASA